MALPAAWGEEVERTPSGEVARTVAESEPYLRLIGLLKVSDAVIAPSVDGHPVAAIYNREAIIPPQCYTKTETAFNACYICHQDPVEGEDRENVMADGDLQAAYSFSDLGMRNHWGNLFEDRSRRVAAVSDSEILSYVQEDNYSELPGRLRTAGFRGWIPDLAGLQGGADAFDDEGFARDGSGWVAFNYKPVPSTFWPTNGSTDDVMIRLPERFRVDRAGRPSRDIYKANLSILEAAIKGRSGIGTLPIDEGRVGADLNGDGERTVVRGISDVRTYVGRAAGEPAISHLYPAGTEFLHTVRYLGFDGTGAVTVSRRMKEVRYMQKPRAYPKVVYARQYELEGFEKEAGNLPGYQNLGPHGLDNGNGWAVQGFIENAQGRLRTYTFEENFSCMGCHNSIGSTIDKTFSFPRKVDGADGWRYIDLKGMRDVPSKGESEGEILTYLARVGGGSEFRNNDEMRERWFGPDGTVDRGKVRSARDVHDLITPSRERALLLNKAYRTIVQDQDFIFGKEATVAPPQNVHERIDNETAATLPEDRLYRWSLLLDWQASNGGS